jgi:hypothetical protein
MGEFKFDRTAFSAMTFEEANNHYQTWKNSSYSERLKAATYLINQSYNISNQTPLDRKVFSKRKHNNG